MIKKIALFLFPVSLIAGIAIFFYFNPEQYSVVSPTQQVSSEKLEQSENVIFGLSTMIFDQNGLILKITGERTAVNENRSLASITPVTASFVNPKLTITANRLQGYLNNNLISFTDNVKLNSEELGQFSATVLNYEIDKNLLTAPLGFVLIRDDGYFRGKTFNLSLETNSIIIKN